MGEKQAVFMRAISLFDRFVFQLLPYYSSGSSIANRGATEKGAFEKSRMLLF
jgi:hypothetical protein